MPSSTGLSGRLEDQADTMIDRWDRFEKVVAEIDSDTSGNI